METVTLQIYHLSKWMLLSNLAHIYSKKEQNGLYVLAFMLQLLEFSYIYISKYWIFDIVLQCCNSIYVYYYSKYFHKKSMQLN